MRSVVKLPTRRLSIIAVIVVALGAAAGAWAYFSAMGSATAHASVGAINPPSNLATSQNSAGAVTITWNAASLSTGGSVQGYTVKRSDGAVVCGSPTLLTDLSCTDSATTPGSTYTYTVTAVYHSFNASATSGSITIVALSAPTLTAKPSSPSANASPSFSFSGGGGTGYQCQLDGAAFTSCTSPSSYSALSNGSHTFKVHAVQGGSTGPDTTYTWTIDTSAPSFTAEPNNPSNSTSPNFSFSHSSYSSFKCSLDGAGYSSCTSPQAYSGLAQGSHTFSVEAVDADGLATAAASYTWTIDTTAPAVSLTKVNGNTVTFPYTTNQTVTSIGGSCGTAPGDLVTVSSAVSGGATESTTTSCASGSWNVTLPTALSSDATYTLSASQSDSAGNTGTTGNQTLIIDTSSPSVSITSPASNSTTLPNPTINGAAGTASGDASTVTVKLYSGTAATGTPVETINNVAVSNGSWSTPVTKASTVGNYTAQVTQTDTAGNTGTATSTFTVSTVTITSPTNGSFTNDTTPTISGAASTNASVVVKIYSGTTATGTPVQTSPNIAPTGSSAPYAWSWTSGARQAGTYTIQATQTPALSSPVTITIDVTAPPAPTITTSSEPANPTSQTSANFAFTDTEAGVSYQCKLDTAAYAACTTPQAYSGLADGSHTFSVQAIDAAGNVSTTAASYTWRVDTTAPTVTLTKVNGTAVTFPYTTNQTVTTIGGTCGTTSGDLVTVTWAVSGGATESATTNCSTGNWSATLTTALSSEATYTLSASQSDSVGNVGTTGAKTLTIDKTPPPAPTITASSQPANPTNQTSANFAFTDTEAGVSYQCKLDGASYATCTSPQAYSNLAQGSHTFSVQAKDAAGNLSTTAASYTWTVDTTMPTVTLTKVNNTAVTFPYTTNQTVTSIGGTCGTASGDLVTVTWAVSGGATESATTNCVSGSWSTTLTTALSSEATYTLSASQSDSAGNTGTTGNQTLTIDKTPPVGLTSWTTANGNGTPGKLDQNDTITLNFSEAIDPSSIISGWTDASTKTGQQVTVKLADSGTGTSTNDTVTICAATDTSCATPLSIGTINLKGNYINSSSGTGVAIFPGSGSGAKSVINGNAVNPTTLTVTLGAMSQLAGGVNLQTQSATSQAIWSGWSFSDLAGNQASNIASATQANAQQQF